MLWLSGGKSNGLSVIVAPSGEGCQLMLFFHQSGHAWTIPGIKAGQQHVFHCWFIYFSHLVPESIYYNVILCLQVFLFCSRWISPKGIGKSSQTEQGYELWCQQVYMSLQLKLLIIHERIIFFIMKEKKMEFKLHHNKLLHRLGQCSPYQSNWLIQWTLLLVIWLVWSTVYINGVHVTVMWIIVSL